MTVYNWLTLLGVPALLAVIVKLIYNSIKGVKMGVQALLRAQMIDDFNRYSEKGYAPIYARENFENCYQQYHRLGANGVMDDLRNKFMALPTRG
ncbi:MAG: hypothetical protein IJ523_08120 [Succinivibrionaceae bacterium]|nr:hypothetical protein [Succinivibrionaceae bacterium]MBQ8708038.1 hypothetical protein [Succinivibrionaceae bacterium]